MKLDYGKIRTAVLVYVTLPVIIFLFGWLKMPLAVITTGLLAIAVIYMIKGKVAGNQDSTYLSVKMLLVIAAIAMIWCFFAGQGGMFYQSQDHEYRNAIFRDLINLDWPVLYDQSGRALVYYLAHWLLPAAVGKLVFTATCSEAAAWIAGNVSLFFWSSLGVWLVLLLLVHTIGVKSNKKVLLVCLMFIFFSGLDVFGCFEVYGKLIWHLEQWAGLYQYSSITTCLFWVFNQTIVPWILILCIINEPSVKSFAFLGLMCLPYGPFPFVGIFVFCVCLGVKFGVEAVRSGRLKAYLKDIFSVENLIAVVTIFPIWALYYMSNSAIGGDAGGGLHFIWDDYDLGFLLGSIWYIKFFALEAGFYFILIFRDNKRNILYYIALGSLLLIAMFRMGRSWDFAMRVSIPAITILGYLTIRSLIDHVSDLKSPRKAVKIFYLLLVSFYLLGAVTPLVEFGRGISKVIANKKINLVADSIITLNQADLDTQNFTCDQYEDKVFFNRLAK